MLFKSYVKTSLLVMAMTLTLFTGLAYAEAVTSPSAITIASEPIPFVDQGLSFIPLKDLSDDLSTQYNIDFSDLKTSDKKNYTFKNGLMTHLQLPLTRENGNFGFQVGSNAEGNLCQVIIQDEKGLFWHQIALKKQGDGSYLAILSKERASIKVLPESYNLILVSRKVPIDGALKFPLTKLSALGITRTSDMSVNNEIGPHLQSMFKASSVENTFDLRVVSGFRTVAKQKSLFNAKMSTLKSRGSKNPYEEAAKTVNPPTQSEHHTGYAVDILSTRVTALGSFKGSPEAKWLESHSYQYGFVVRYPDGKTNITGISYEPWHFRYVGKNYAKLLKDKKLTLEEWLAKGKQGILYKGLDGNSHYFLVLPSALKSEVLNDIIATSEIKKYYVSPDWVAYDMVIPD